ncbi:MAG: SDR family oxidoreductase [Gammaproteobacteria bacterium]|jgi:short-subunit dehydrogenase|uniref:SDR family oxidoreductase n=1 Tax=Nevskia sp. TaxID=1929292 RepID=UPI0040355C8D|nr:SDR family oxidoreductase [Gammaproteobacteria bacterium]
MSDPNRRFLLTGASGGIGSAVARELVRHGHAVVLSGRNERRLAALAADLLQTYPSADVGVAAGDLSGASGVAAVVAAAGQGGRALDGVVNCAGQSWFGHFEETPDSVLDTLWRTNVLAPMRLIQAALPLLRGRRGAMVVNVGSVFGSIGYPCFAAYSATKFALRGLTEALRRELADDGIAFVYVAPRYTRTALNEGAVEIMAAATGMNEDSPEQVARAIVAAIERGTRERVLGGPERFFVWLNSWLPRLVDKALGRQARQMRAYLNPTVVSLSIRTETSR